MAVDHFYGKIFYPVMFEGDAAGALERATIVNNKQKEMPVFQQDELHCEEMRQGVGSLLCREHCEQRIGRVYQVQRREVFFFPKNSKGLFFCPRAGSRVPIALTGMRFWLFETQVAFLEMDVELAALELADAMNATYYLCEVKDEANHFEYENRVFDPETRQTRCEAVSFSLKQWFLKCADYLPGCRNFEDRPLASTISKPLLYGCYLLSGPPADFERTACNIAQNYKLSYKGTAEGFRDHVLKTFENSYWCASYNGAVNLSYSVEDSDTNRFFETTFLHKWATEYLFLFIATIHQKYAVQKHLNELGALACPRCDFERMLQLLQQSEVMQEKCMLLQNRCFFQLPSHVEHVNRVYSFFQWCFDIPGYAASLSAGIENSVGLCKSYLTRVKGIQDCEQEMRGMRNEMYIALLTLSVTCLTFFNSFYATLLALLEGRFGAVDVGAVVVAGTFLATVSGAAYKLFDLREKLREKRLLLRHLKERSDSL